MKLFTLAWRNHRRKEQDHSQRQQDPLCSVLSLLLEVGVQAPLTLCHKKTLHSFFPPTALVQQLHRSLQRRETCFKPPCCLTCGEDVLDSSTPLMSTHISPAHPLSPQQLCGVKCLQKEKLGEAYHKTPGEEVSSMLTEDTRVRHSNICSRWTREWEFAKIPCFPGQPVVYWVTSVCHILKSLIDGCLQKQDTVWGESWRPSQRYGERRLAALENLHKDPGASGDHKLSAIPKLKLWQAWQEAEVWVDSKGFQLCQEIRL